MPELSVKNQIRRMIDLQKIDSEIYNIKAGLTEKPALIEELKKGFEATKTHLKTLEDQLKGIQLQRKDLELELKSKEDGIAKANAQLLQLKTNKEYHAKQAEIEGFKADKSMIEEKILVSFDKADAMNAEITKEKATIGEKEKQYLSKKKEIEDEVKLGEDRIKVLESQRKQILPEIDPNCLSRYEKVLAHKGGLAIVPVEGSSCGGCHMNVTAQQINLIKMHEQLIECEMCQRILYIEDDL